MKFFALLLSLFITMNALAAINIDLDTMRSPDHSKVWTPPSASTTLVGRDTNDNLSNKTLDKLVTTTEQIDAATTGSNATVVSITSIVVQITNASLVSIDGVSAPSNNQIFVLKNKTGVAVTLNNETGATTANRIVTGTGANLVLANDASVILAYSTADSRWQIVGGSGGGGSLSAWVTAHAYLAGDIAIESNKLYKAVSDHTSGTFATDLGNGLWIEISAGVTDHTALSNIGTNTHAQIDTHIANTSNPHSVTAAQVGLGSVVNADTTTTANITDSVDKRFVTDAEETAIGTISGKQDKSTLTTKGDLYVATASATTARQAVGNDGQVIVADSGQTNGIRYSDLYEKNYIANDGAETDTTGWSVYADAAATSPVDMTGGSPVSTFSRTTSSNLNGSGSFTFSKSGANRQGEGFSYAFSIDNADATKVLRIDFNYQVSSGTYVDDDMQCWIYDTTNSALIQPAPFKIKNTTGKESMSMEFQATTSTTYRFGCHVASTSTSAYDLKFDKFKISKGAKVYGSPISDWVSYTPTVTGAGAVGNLSAYWRKEGDSIALKIRFDTGAPTATQARVSLPSGLTISSISTALELAGAWVRNVSATEGGSVLISSGNNYVTFGSQASGTSGLSSLNASSIWGTSQVVSLHAKIPIAGWSSSVQMSDAADTRVVLFSGYKPSNEAVTADVTNIAYTSLKDSHSAWNGTQYTVPVPGDYKLSATFNSTSINSSIEVFLNGSLFRTIGSLVSGEFRTGTTTLYSLKAGDVISLRSTQTHTLTGGASTGNAQLNIEKLSGPSQIAASETVSASYWLSANFAASTTTPINFDSKEWDTHGSVTTSATAWKFTAPIAGEFTITALTQAGANSANYFIYKNGSAYKYVSNHPSGGVAIASTKVKLVAGDYIDIRPHTSLTILGSAISSSSSSNITITRTGNY